MSSSSDRAEEIAQVFIEKIEDQFSVMQENMDDMLDRKLQSIQTDMTELKSDMKIVKAAVTDQSKQLSDHESRISDFETAR